MFKKKRVLTTDSDQVFLMQMCMLMRKMGLKVTPAEDGSEVLKLVKLQRPDLIMLDVHRSTQGGVKTLRHLLEDKETANIPVVIVSSDMKGETIETCRALGANAFLSKPVDIWELHGVLQDCLFAGERFRRKYLRTPYHGEVTLVSNESTYSIPAETLSEKGIYLVTPEPLPVGTALELSVPLNDGNALSLKGNIIYHRDVYEEQGDTPSGMAIEFVDNDEERHKVISAFIKDLMTRDIRSYQEDSFAL